MRHKTNKAYAPSTLRSTVSCVLLTQDVKSLTYYALQLQFGRVNEFCHSKVLWAHLVYAKRFLTINIACYDSLYKILAIDVHRQYLVIFS